MLNTNPQPETQPITTSDTPLVVLSDAAAGKLADLVAAENNPAIGLRVYVYSGGCSGFRYGMMLEDQPSGEDVTVESKGIKVYVDAQSTQYIAGSEIDYLDTLAIPYQPGTTSRTGKPCWGWRGSPFMA